MLGRAGRPGVPARPCFAHLSPWLFIYLFVFGLQFPGGNDNYLTITGPSHPFLSGAEVSKSCRRWGAGGPRQRLGPDGGGERGGGRELGRTVAEASRASEDSERCGGGTNGKRLSSENQDVEELHCLFKEGVRF